MAPSTASVRPKNGAHRNQGNKNKNKNIPSKEASKRQDKATISSTPESSIPLELQQSLLNIFRTTFTKRLDSDFAPLLQQVKQHLYNRDFSKAFGRIEYLEVYAARWSPSRALGYLQVFNDISDHLLASQKVFNAQNEDSAMRISCLGGGAGAEIVALAGFENLLKQQARNKNECPILSSNKKECMVRTQSFGINAIDIANWSSVVQNLFNCITTAPPLSKYASAATQAANAPLANLESFQVACCQYDLLSADFSELSPLLKDAGLVTLMFTLNELYSTSISHTQKFMLNLTSCVRPGTLLLVVDSPGSYSTVSLNGTERKYPMQWLLDHNLLRNTITATSDDQEEKEIPWEKLVTDESHWFRLPEGLKYPIELENMRYQLHLFRKI
ncbi:hypothetical protein K432DRAFT_210406 [Lepidopterella palustris CBS 459.81]|uniref:25S rRNA (Uridine(2843)-N(3))-methyltransferase n=1 Tax=Lepidopterella palustris CBS 459.81 TaxID=1314670 RepID=A0A8E2J9C5_9PEZI|nr:hypothetical protein K432DRAFT_210406 [Lepidopterella palustris CBS 459.81]